MHRAIRWAGTTIWLLAGALALAGTASAQRVEGDRAGAQGVYGNYDEEQCVSRIGKKAAGRLLDGRTWDEYPIEMGS